MRNRSLYFFLAATLGLAVLAGCNHSAPVRTDAQIASDVQGKIYSDSAVQSRSITVQAADGVVTLSGDVSSDSERVAASNDAGAVSGVKTVINNLQVQQAQAAPPVTPPPAEMPSRKTSTRRHHHADVPADNDSNLQAQNAAQPSPAPEAQPQPVAPPPSPPPPPPQKVTIPAGTQLSVRLNDSLDSEKNQVGDTFHGSLSAPIVIDGETVIPSGADVVGRVANVQSAGRFAGASLLTLELTSLTVNGKTYNVQTNQWTRSGEGKGKSTAEKVGGGAAVGAILGGLIGGGRGAAIGAAAGGAGGTGVAAAQKRNQIKLAPEAVLNFQTIDVLTVMPQGTNDRNAGRAPLS
jgi:hypothetical protein